MHLLEGENSSKLFTSVYRSQGKSPKTEKDGNSSAKKKSSGGKYQGVGAGIDRVQDSADLRNTEIVFRPTDVAIGILLVEYL